MSIDGAATLCSVVNDDERVQGKMRTNTLNQKSFRFVYNFVCVYVYVHLSVSQVDCADTY